MADIVNNSPDISGKSAYYRDKRPISNTSSLS